MAEKLPKCELFEGRWAIIDAKNVIATELTYDEAAEQIKSLNGYEATIVTNEVADRMLTNKAIR